MQGSKEVPPRGDGAATLLSGAEKRDFKMEDALLALKRARELAEQLSPDGVDLTIKGAD